MIYLHADSSAVSEHAKMLRAWNRSALPVVVRQTLNRAAFRVKTDTMPKEASIFVHRKENFFKANSGVTQANGFDINSMRAVVGFKPKPSDNSQSVEDLEAQEEGGLIKSRPMVALKSARSGESWQGLTQNKRRRDKRKILDAKNNGGGRVGRNRSAKEKFVLTAMYAQKIGATVIGNRVNDRGNKIAWSIKRGKFGRAKRRMVMTFSKKYVENQLFAVKAGRQVRPKATHFMRNASMTSAKRMEADFIELASKKMTR